jgi:hypothetical protein
VIIWNFNPYLSNSCAFSELFPFPKSGYFNKISNYAVNELLCWVLCAACYMAPLPSHSSKPQPKYFSHHHYLRVTPKAKWIQLLPALATWCCQGKWKNSCWKYLLIPLDSLWHYLNLNSKGPCWCYSSFKKIYQDISGNKSTFFRKLFYWYCVDFSNNVYEI